MTSADSDLVSIGEALLARTNAGDKSASGELTELLPALARLAEDDRPDAQALVGGIYLDLLKDPANSVAFFQRAASAGYPAGSRGLGHLYANGLGVQRDLPRAAELFAVAAGQGDQVAKFNLATMYIHGIGVERDSTRGLRLLRESADAGMPYAAALWAHACVDAGHDSDARHYYKIAAQGGLSRAMLDLASAYRDGLGGDRDQVQAVRWFLKAVERGDGDGVHEAISLAKTMTHDEIRHAAHLAGNDEYGEMLIRRIP